MSEKLTNTNLGESLNIYFNETDTAGGISNHHIHASILGNGAGIYLMLKSEIPAATKLEPDRRRTAWWSMTIKDDVYKRFLSYIKRTENVGDK